jgi:predicted acylesterase/phospholipase RssA
MSILEVYILPVSGGGFPAQLQELIYFSNEKQLASQSNENIEIIPDICLGTSGGNVSAYVALSGNWSEGGIKRVVKSMNSSMFSQTWWPGPMGFLPTWILGIFEGAIYKPGYGPKTLLEAFSDKNTIKNVEIWSGTFNKTQKRSGFFCNKNEEETYISSITYSPYLFKTMPLQFLNGDINKISKITVASASVPILFKPVEYEGEEYIDGGVTYSSPLTPMQEELYNIIKGITTPSMKDLMSSPFPLPSKDSTGLKGRRGKDYLHMTYFSPYNMDNTTEKIDSTIGVDSFLSYMTDSSSLKDRSVGITLLQRLKTDSQDIYFEDSRYTTFTLNELLGNTSSTHYFCEIYVRNNEWIDLNKFTSQDILNKMSEAESQIEWRFWYVN